MALARSLLSVGLAAELGCGAGPPADGGAAAVGALALALVYDVRDGREALALLRARCGDGDALLVDGGAMSTWRAAERSGLLPVNDDQLQVCTVLRAICA